MTSQKPTVTFRGKLNTDRLFYMMAKFKAENEERTATKGNGRKGHEPVKTKRNT